ncbi:hypothetical protein R1flu_005623 [Riccia fluitans]|uniref:Protein kinase domain-containing protein n=1 Tax=Riccia fluitans TaxID=41844 RepID=A0ABD1YTN7_9MARC
MEGAEKVTHQKVRFLAHDLLLKGGPRTLDDVRKDCRLFDVTEEELVEFTLMPVELGDRVAKALEIPFTGSINVTSAYIEEVGRKTVVVPFRDNQYLGGECWRKAIPAEPFLPEAEKHITSPRHGLSDSITFQLPNVVEAAVIVSTPIAGESHFSQNPSDGATTPSYATVTYEKRSLQSNASQWATNGGSALCQSRNVGDTSLVSPPRASTEILACLSNCESASSQGPAKRSASQQGESLSFQELLQRSASRTPSTIGLKKTDESTPPVGHVAGVKDPPPSRCKKPRAVQKLELNTGALTPDVVEGTTNRNELTSRLTRSAAANLPKAEFDTPARNIGRDSSHGMGENETPDTRKRGRAKGLVTPPNVNGKKVVNTVQAGVNPVVRLELGGLEHSEIAGECRSQGVTHKHEANDLENPVQENVLAVEETKSPGSVRKKRKTVMCTAKPATKIRKIRGGKAAIASPPAISSVGLTSIQLVNESVSVVSKAVPLEAIGEAGVSVSASKKLFVEESKCQVDSVTHLHPIPANVHTTEDVGSPGTSGSRRKRNVRKAVAVSSPVVPSPSIPGIAGSQLVNGPSPEAGRSLHLKVARGTGGIPVASSEGVEDESEHGRDASRFGQDVNANVHTRQRAKSSKMPRAKDTKAPAVSFPKDELASSHIADAPASVIGGQVFKKRVSDTLEFQKDSFRSQQATQSIVPKEIVSAEKLPKRGRNAASCTVKPQRKAIKNCENKTAQLEKGGSSPLELAEKLRTLVSKDVGGSSECRGGTIAHLVNVWTFEEDLSIKPEKKGRKARPCEAQGVAVSVVSSSTTQFTSSEHLNGPASVVERALHIEVSRDKRVSAFTSEDRVSDKTHCGGRLVRSRYPIKRNIQVTKESGLSAKPPSKGRKGRVCTGKPAANMLNNCPAKVFTATPPSGTSLCTSGLTNSQVVSGAVSSVGGAVAGETIVSFFTSGKPAGDESEFQGDAERMRQLCRGNVNHGSSDDVNDATGAFVSGRNENLHTVVESTGAEGSDLLYATDSEETPSADKPPAADVTVQPTTPMHKNPSDLGGHPGLSAVVQGADESFLGSEMIQRHIGVSNAKRSSVSEEAPGTEAVFTTDPFSSLKSLSHITDALRQMKTMRIGSTAEHAGDACGTKVTSLLVEEKLKLSLAETHACASLPCPEGTTSHGIVRGVAGSENSLDAYVKQFDGQIESFGKSHVSMHAEWVQDDIDHRVAQASSSSVKQDTCQIVCNHDMGTVMCGKSATVSTYRDAASHAGVQPFELHNGGAAAVAGDELAASVSNPFQCANHECAGRNEMHTTVYGEESYATSTHVSKAHAVEADCTKDVCECQGLVLAKDTLSSLKTVSALANDVPTKESKQSSGDEQAKAICTLELLGSSAVSRSAVGYEHAYTGGHNICADDRYFTRPVLAQELSKVADPVCLQTGANPSTVATSVMKNQADMLASIERMAVAAEKIVKDDRKEGSLAADGNVCCLEWGTAKVGCDGSNFVKFRAGEDSASRCLVGTCGNGSEVSPVGDIKRKQLENLATVPVQEAQRDRTPDRAHPGNQPGTSHGNKDREPEYTETLKALDAVVPANVKIIDFSNKQKKEEMKIVPEFDNYTIIGEEGSGGYGTVYRVRSKVTGKIYAMKCPLLKTHSSSVDNEIDILQLLGGKEFIIKFLDVVPGRFRTPSNSGEKLSKCKSILLEFMEHDKPEVLKKEISVEELKIYSICLFRALAHMHRQKITHLDIKPGNFLFSRSKKCGFLVDFNLARDEQLQRRVKKVLPGHSHIISRTDPGRSSKRPLDTTVTPSNYSKRSRLLMELGTPSPARTSTVSTKQSIKSAGRGVSADATVSSPKLPHLAQSAATTPIGAVSAPRGTTELPNLVNEHRAPGVHQQFEGSVEVAKNLTRGLRLQSHHPALFKYIEEKNIPTPERRPMFDQQNTFLPSSQRKRVAAAHSKKTNAAPGIIPLVQRASQPTTTRRVTAPAKPKGYVHHAKDGPCAGTKGYRAPEVLLKSLKQTSKVDMWSAGVSLLQLISGRSPFPSSSSDSALRDIAKVRGSDAILALATRHERHQSISKELLAEKYPPVTIKEWCERHSRRSDLKGKVPAELFDLLERCLDVDPDSRITAEEALKHQFCSTSPP